MAAISSTSDNDIDAVHNGVHKIECTLYQSDAYSDCSKWEKREAREAREAKEATPCKSMVWLGAETLALSASNVISLNVLLLANSPVQIHSISLDIG